MFTLANLARWVALLGILAIGVACDDGGRPAWCIGMARICEHGGCPGSCIQDSCCDTRCTSGLGGVGSSCSVPGYTCTFEDNRGGYTLVCGDDLLVHCVNELCPGLDLSPPRDLSALD
jgi:hypothetical protein